MLHTAPARQAEPALLETRFGAMGSAAHVVVVDGPPDAPTNAQAAIAALEQRWSRFRTDSEVSRINAAAGRPVTVSAATATLVALAIRGWTATAGAYDPTVLDAVVAAGYDRPLDERSGQPIAQPDLASTPTLGDPGGTVSTPAPGCAGIIVDRDTGAVRLPPGVHIDPGGIGKGLAADMDADMLITEGAAGALVNVGGDVRVAGTPPSGGWRIDVDLPATAPRHLLLRSGAVATSGTHRRRWVRYGKRLHHLIDPRTGAPLASPFVAATVVAGGAWWAEVLTKALLLAPSISDVADALAGAGAAGLVVDHDGSVHRIADIERFKR